jgi:hypothetical protein
MVTSARTALRAADPRTAEAARLEEMLRGVPWQRWGPYVSDRQWGTVREDYSEHGTPWEYFPHDHARSRAIAGARTASPASATVTNGSASGSAYGTAATRSSRNACLA